MWRTLSLGFFIFVSSIIYVVCNSVITTVKDNSRDALIHGLTGDVQIRNFDVEQQDFVDMNTSWQNAEYLKAEELTKAKEYVSSNVKDVNAYERVRHAGALTLGDNYSDALMIGIEGEDTDYQLSFVLSEGTYVKSNGEKQIVLTNEIADKLKAGVGDMICANALDVKEEGTTIELTVVGIGTFESLAGYGSNMCFMDIDSVRALKGLSKEEATELILRGTKAEEAKRIASSIQKNLNTQKQYMVTSWDTQGGYVKVINTMITVVFYIFMVILMFIICLSIGNMVGVIAIERVREIGTMRAIGFSKGRVNFLFVSEIFLICVIASTIGVVIASIVCLIISGHSISVGNPLNIIIGSHFKLQYSLISSVPGLLVFILLGCLAADFPIRKMNKNQLVDLVNNEY